MIILFLRKHFELVNGLSNRYWGWGLEDDEFYVRLKDAHLNITRPVNITTGTNDTFRYVVLLHIVMMISFFNLLHTIQLKQMVK